MKTIQLNDLREILETKLKMTKPMKKALRDFEQLPGFVGRFDHTLNGSRGGHYWEGMYGEKDPEGHYAEARERAVSKLCFSLNNHEHFIEEGDPLMFTLGWMAATEKPLYFVILPYSNTCHFYFFSKDPTEAAKERYKKALVRAIHAA